MINLCFVDDLFIFSYGNVSSVLVHMDSLDMFKNVSGLSPSLSKSIVFLLMSILTLNKTLCILCHLKVIYQ